MAIIDHIETSGQLLFRWRGYLPLIIVFLAMLAVGIGHSTAGASRSENSWELACLAVSAFGLAIRVVAVGHAPAGTSGRNARAQRALALNTTGIYSLVRHPLYLGNFFLMLGVVLFARSLWLAVGYVLAFWLYYERIMAAEESFLRRTFGAAFDAWSAAVPAFVPRLSGWIPPALAFSAKNVLRREYNGFFAVPVSMFLINLVSNAAERGRWQPDPRWSYILAGSACIWIVLRLLKRHTSLLRVEGR